MYKLIANHFDNADAKLQRTNVSDAGLMSYCHYILDRLRPPKNSKLLDVGCGDGKIISGIKKIRPDLIIDGIDISKELVRQARDNNPTSSIFIGNVLDFEFYDEKQLKGYDIVYSFSVLQYIKPNDLYDFQTSLIKCLKLKGGVIIHCSIPDVKMRAVNFAENFFKKYGFYAWIITPGYFIYSVIKKGSRYGIYGFWHNSFYCKNKFNLAGGETEILSGDVYYRFDIKTTI
jgi:cyclopropane fatty-acyl-phospholipid synthase-like methyltransferase